MQSQGRHCPNQEDDEGKLWLGQRHLSMFCMVVSASVYIICIDIYTHTQRHTQLVLARKTQRGRASWSLS